MSHWHRRLLLPFVTLVAAPLFAGWSPLGGPVPPEVELKVSPGRPRLLYARVLASEGPEVGYLWRSRDGGVTWVDLQKNLLLPSSALAIDPANPERIFLWATRGELWQSDDAGDSWSRKYKVPANRGAPNVLGLLADRGHLAWVEYDGGGVRTAVSGDGGQTFASGAPVPLFSGLEGVFLHSARGELVAFDQRGLEVSTNDGSSWTVRGRYRGAGFVGGRLAPSAPDTMYGLPAGGRDCLARSDDGGAHWVRLAQPRLPGPNGSCYDVTVDPVEPLHVWVAARAVTAAGTVLRLFESRDGGAHWSRPLAMPGQGVVAASATLLYTGGSRASQGLYASADAGRTWRPLQHGIAAGDLRQGLAVQRPPQGGVGRRVVGLQLLPGVDFPAVFYSGGGKVWTRTPELGEVLADAGGSTLVAASNETVRRSRDGGATWSPIPGAPAAVFGLRAGAASSPFLALDSFEEGGDYGRMALWLSDDAGASWRRASEGLPIDCTHAASVDWCPRFSPYAVDPFDPRRRWVAFGGSFFAPRIFRSDDSGASWQLATADLAAITALAADPRVPGRILAGTAGGLFESADGGLHWLSLGEDLPAGSQVLQLLPDLRYGIWYASTAAHGLYRSPDGGATWTPLMGQPDLESPTIALDPRRAEALLAAFAGQGLWRWTP